LVTLLRVNVQSERGADAERHQSRFGKVLEVVILA
jgi:hypothetical protein